MNDKEKQIINAAQKLFIKNGFQMTSIQDILNEAKIAKGTFYNYFNSKNECLMAILGAVYEEIINERMEIASYGELDDEKLFVRQMEVRFKMDKKHNLMALFNSIPISDDEDLKSLMKKQYESELEWVSKRLIDLYGSNISKHIMDHSITFLGILQHSMHAIKMYKMETKKTEEVIEFALRRTKMIIHSNTSDEVFFHTDYLHSSSQNRNSGEYKEALIYQLQELQSSVKNDNHYIDFLIDELLEETPRLFLIESVFTSLRKEEKDVDVINKINEISQLLLRFMECWESENESC
ncbi:TetR/AcrR family transcriptional regulator [Oceanobacillus caeni]|uniref:TetR/AcrR family transcriptional regulator n=1 Tax=Oceanobacillus caeni TaxID=405946 RepID=UPI002149D49C|nr:TetR/AcrR family transcriptional regulator [Oceanobacillus caeni]MCR1835165.1 TetR/AcrR family transcriptional regulator [Oceanobacillus caeni]